MSLPYGSMGSMSASDSYIVVDPEKANIVRTSYQQYL